MSHYPHLLEIIDIGKRLWNKNMIAAADGNISYRVSDSEILITPTQKHKGYLSEQDIAVIDIENKIICGNPSGEREMHLAVYRKVKEAKCVVHAHPVHAIAWSVANPNLKELPNGALSEGILAVGSIPIVPYARPGTKTMGENLDPFLPQNRVMILSRHGAISWGESLEEAYFGMERVEAIASILKIAQELGGISNLPQDEIEYLKEARKKIGNQIL